MFGSRYYYVLWFLLKANSEKINTRTRQWRRMAETLKRVLSSPVLRTLARRDGTQFWCIFGVLMRRRYEVDRWIIFSVLWMWQRKRINSNDIDDDDDDDRATQFQALGLFEKMCGINQKKKKKHLEFYCRNAATNKSERIFLPLTKLFSYIFIWIYLKCWNSFFEFGRSRALPVITFRFEINSSHGFSELNAKPELHERTFSRLRILSPSWHLNNNKPRRR